MLNRYGYVLYATFATVSLIGAIAYFSQTGELSGAIALIFVTGVLTLSARSYREPDQKHAEYKEAFMSLGDSDFEPITVDLPGGQLTVKIVEDSSLSTDSLDPPSESSADTDEVTAVTAKLGDEDPPKESPSSLTAQTLTLQKKLGDAELQTYAGIHGGRVNARIRVFIVPNALSLRDVDRIRKLLGDAPRVYDNLEANVSEELTGGVIVWSADSDEDATPLWKSEIEELKALGALYSTWSPYTNERTPIWNWYVGLMREMLNIERNKAATKAQDASCQLNTPQPSSAWSRGIAVLYYF